MRRALHQRAVGQRSPSVSASAARTCSTVCAPLIRTPARPRPRRCRRRATARGGRRPPRAHSARASTVPRIVRTGRPDSSEMTSASCQAGRRGRRAPWRSPPWRRTGRRARRVPRRLDGGEQPVAQPRRAFEGDRRNARCRPRRSRYPTITAPTRRGHSTVTDLARLRGWSTSWPISGGQLAGEELQRHDRDERLQEHRHLGQPDQVVGVRLDPLITLLGQTDRAARRGRGPPGCR